MTTIFYDSIITGHHAEYINHVVDYIDDLDNNTYYFIVPRSFKDKFGEIIERSASKPCIHWYFIPEKDVTHMESLPRWRRSFFELDLVTKYARELFATHVFLMYYDFFEIALIFKRPNFSISGIQFIQLFRLSKITLKEKLRYYKKYLYTKLYLQNKAIKTVFILNDKEGEIYLNQRFSTKQFKTLIDPIPRHKRDIQFDTYSHYNILSNKKILLHPGSINARKGTLEIIESIDKLSSAAQESFAFLIVGKSSQSMEIELRSKIDSLNNKQVTIIFDNTFVSNEKLASLFHDSYAILIPYKNAEASSGILGHAALAFKPVIAPGNGLLGSMVNQYRLGLTVKEISAINLATSIDNISNFTLETSEVEQFLHDRHPKEFSKRILASL